MRGRRGSFGSLLQTPRIASGVCGTKALATKLAFALAGGEWRKGDDA